MLEIKKYGRWTPIECRRGADLGGKRFYRWLCRCDCGTVRLVYEQNLKRGLSKSCGCINKDNPPHRTHGHTRDRKQSPEYSSWRGMLERCEDPNSIGYHRYGGRGITVCERWHKFENFLADMGLRGQGLTLDRENTDRNYEPGNCKWSDWPTQCKGRRPKSAEHKKHLSESLKEYFRSQP